MVPIKLVNALSRGMRPLAIMVVGAAEVTQGAGVFKMEGAAVAAPKVVVTRHPQPALRARNAGALVITHQSATIRAPFAITMVFANGPR
jgi:hypothetical protein